MGRERGQGHECVRVQPALVVHVLKLRKPGAITAQELFVQLLKLDQDVGEEGFLGEQGQVLAGHLVVVPDQVVDGCGWVWIRCVHSTS